jgi:FkbM family methyltransferase
MKKAGWLYLRLRNGYLYLLDLFTRKKGVKVFINDFNIRLPGRYSRYFPKDYEKVNFDFLKKSFKPGMTGIDIGAHLGIYSIRMAQLGASGIFSFEPTPSTFRHLKKIIKLNHFEDTVSASQSAIGLSSGKAIFHLNAPGNRQNKMSVAEANSLKYIDHGDRIKKTEHTVNTFSVDDFVDQNGLKVDFIKMDAEGSELDILNGAIKTLGRDKPSGIISIHCFAYEDREQELKELWRKLESLQLNLFFNNEPISREELMKLAAEDIFDLQFN